MRKSCETRPRKFSFLFYLTLIACDQNRARAKENEFLDHCNEILPLFLSHVGWEGGGWVIFRPSFKFGKWERGRARFKTPKARQEDRNKVRIETEQGEVTLTGDILGFPFLSPIQTTHADFLFSLSLPLCLFGKEVREGVDFSTKTRSSGTHDDFPHPFFPLLLFPCVGT